jgi:hypothetical protein
LVIKERFSWEDWRQKERDQMIDRELLEAVRVGEEVVAAEKDATRHPANASQSN